MAGDWIKFELATLDKPEVVMIAEELAIDQDAVIGKLLRFWGWCDQQSRDGRDIKVTESFLDRLTFEVGFCAALINVGWLHKDDTGFGLPNFDRHNGKPAKSRALGTRNKQKSRQCRDEDETGQRLEKRREEIKRYPTLEQAREAAPMVGITPDQAEKWWHTREASGWMRANASGGSVPVGTNWRSDMKITAPKLTGGKTTRGNRNTGTSNDGQATPTAPRPKGV